MTTLLHVETGDFLDASRTLYSAVADPVTEAVFALTTALSGTGAMAGSDPAGQQWAAAYDRAAETAVRAGIDLANGCYHLSALFAQTARNYDAAEAASSPGGSAPPPLAAPDPTRVGTGAFPPTAVGGSAPLPVGWGAVEHAVGRVWPNGHQDRLRNAAVAWDIAARRLRDCGWHPQLAAARFLLDGLPEGTDMVTVCQAAGADLQSVAAAYEGLAGACRDLARHIDTVHSAVEHELVTLAWQSVAIEGIGAVVSAFTLGAAQVPTQGIEMSRIAAIAARVRELIDTFTVAARAAAAMAAAQAARLDAVLAEIRGMFELPLTPALVTSAGRLPATGRLAEELAVARIDQDSRPLQALIMQRRRMAGAGGDFGAAGGRETWADPRTLTAHFARHGADFGARSEDEYAAMAGALLRKAALERLPVKFDAASDTVRVWDPATGAFGSYTSKGLTRTFYKPAGGAAYWNRQPGVLRP